MKRLLPIHALHSAGETMFAISLVGSLFFKVSVDAARPLILLYLALTMAPFAVLGPLIGPAIDRVRAGHRGVMVFALGGRAVLAFLLASQLRSLLFYPEAFVILVLAKTYTVSRNSLVPVLVDDRDHLVVVNSRLARTGTIAGTLAAPVGVAILQLAGSGWVLRAGAVAYGLGALAAARIPPPHPELTSLLVESTELSGPGIRSATRGMAALRAAVGFVLFHVGFALKTAGEAAWFFGVVGASQSLGGFVGTFVAPRFRQRWGGQAMLTAAVAVPAAFALVAALRFHRVTVVALAVALGLGVSLARRAFDGVVQTEAPHARRGQAYAGLETRLELAWVVGALAAVLARAPDWIGLAVLCTWLAVVALERVARAFRTAHAAMIEGPAALPLRLLETAESVAALGDPEQAVVVAAAAAEAASKVRGGPQPPEMEKLQRLQEMAAAGNGTEHAEEALDLARVVVGDALDAAAEQ